MSADSWVLVALLTVYFVGLVVTLILDPKHLLDAWKRAQR